MFLGRSASLTSIVKKLTSEFYTNYLQLVEMKLKRNRYVNKSVKIEY